MPTGSSRSESSPPDVRPSPARAGAARATMEVLAESSDVFATFFEQARIGLALADLAGSYVRANPTYAELVGREPEDLLGVSVTELLHPDDRSAGERELAALIAGEQDSLRTEQRYVRPHGPARWVLHGMTVVPGPDGRPAWLAVSAQDITERRRAEQELRDLAAVLSERAVRDALTGVANRELLEERLRAGLARDARNGGGTGLLFLDLDDFKAVNDEYGHEAGDVVLRAVAARLSGAVRPSDTVARLGGDEFVVLVEAPSQADLEPVVARLRAALAVPVDLPGDAGRLAVRASIGVAWVGGGDAEPAALLRRADASMYEAKRRRARSR